ncbi:MAG TPA: NADPH-dependent FMN reductase [Malonomonas sp.]
MKILAISGSLRQASYNTQLLKLAGRCMPDRVDFSLYTCGALPLYNQELDGADKPAAVQELLERIDAADGLLIATPEYNYSVPGVLKNAIDWASRPAFRSVLKGRPTAIISASMSGLGGIRAQIHLKQILGGTLTPVFPAADFLVSTAHQVFSADGGVTDATLPERLQQYLADFVAWIEEGTT